MSYHGIAFRPEGPFSLLIDPEDRGKARHGEVGDERPERIAPRFISLAATPISQLVKWRMLCHGK
jgi:hypothetical protein